jgi:hypothetical protein
MKLSEPGAVLLIVNAVFAGGSRDLLAIGSIVSGPTITPRHPAPSPRNALAKHRVCAALPVMVPHPFLAGHGIGLFWSCQ